MLWTCFPEAYASITLTLFVPLTLAALGIVLRGASFAFRKAVFRTRDRRNFGAAFALSSVLVPYCLGAVVGGIASGRVPAGGKAGDPWNSWVNPTSVLGGVLAVCADGLPRRRSSWSRDAGRLSDETMVAYFRRRATAAAVAAGVVARRRASSCSPTTRSTSSTGSRRGPCRWSSSRRSCGLARSCCSSAARQPAAPAWPPSARSPASSWPGASRSGTTCCPSRSPSPAAAAPSGTITAVLVATALAAVLLVPAFVLLYVLDQKSLLPDEGVPDPTPRTKWTPADPAAA